MRRDELDEVIRASPIEILDGRFAVLQVDDQQTLGPFFLLCRDQDETTVIAREDTVPWGSSTAVEKWFRLLAIHVAAPFAAPGFLAAVAGAIAEHDVNVFIVSAFSKDYILLREEDLEEGCKALRGIGFNIRDAQIGRLRSELGPEGK